MTCSGGEGREGGFRKQVPASPPARVWHPSWIHGSQEHWRAGCLLPPPSSSFPDQLRAGPPCASWVHTRDSSSLSASGMPHLGHSRCWVSCGAPQGLVMAKAGNGAERLRGHGSAAFPAAVRNPGLPPSVLTPRFPHTVRISRGASRCPFRKTRPFRSAHVRRSAVRLLQRVALCPRRGAERRQEGVGVWSGGGGTGVGAEGELRPPEGLCHVLLSLTWEERKGRRDHGCPPGPLPMTTPRALLGHRPASRPAGLLPRPALAAPDVALGKEQ